MAKLRVRLKPKQKLFHFMFGYYKTHQVANGIQSIWYSNENLSMSYSEQLAHNQKDPNFKTFRFTPCPTIRVYSESNSNAPANNKSLLEKIRAWFL